MARPSRWRAWPVSFEPYRNEQPRPNDEVNQGETMTDRKVWFITGAGRGMGADFARAVLATGDRLLATSRHPGRLAEQLGASENLLAVKLDITRPEDAEAAVGAAVERFGRIDVLVNNAATFEAGFFEEMTPAQIESQLTANLFGQMHVTRAVLPVMRKQRSGHIITMSSTAGLASGVEFTSAYAASKFAVEGWMEALRAEVAPFGIHVTVVNPGFFRTELLSEQSTNYAEPTIADYAERGATLRAGWKATHGQQAGDPAKLAQALLTVAAQEPPPRRFLAGADAIATAEQKIADLRADIESNRQLSTSLAFDRS
jgi:NAD(P)-dependent dehydrogenase (short-subunit alcohol dehydrogenase family)